MKQDYAKVMRHHRAAWRAERIGWGVMAILLVAAMLGLFGDGPLSRARAGSDRAFGIEYHRLVRSSAPSLYRVHVQPSMVRDGTLRLRIDRTLVDRMELESIVPAPEQETLGPGYTEFTFLLAPGARPAVIDLRYRPATFGVVRGRISIAGEHALAIEQFAYP